MTPTSLVQDVLLRPIVFTRPIRLVEPPSWIAHIPFAFWIVDALRPRRIVELGTMSGNSYAAFAQAVQTLGIDTSCYAVDTWLGDAHAGDYGPEVFEEWSQFHDQNFGAFSRLVRSTFDEALQKFQDGSIDLLHIDGLHTYDAVRHDFESWLPKLSNRAVVLLHDVNVRERDFGVWEFWQELTKRYPCFEFLHGHGLGVVGVGSTLPLEVKTLVEQVPHRLEEAVLLRQFFSALGNGLLAMAEAGPLQRHLSSARAQLTGMADLERIRGELQAQIQQAQGERDRLRSALAQRELELANQAERIEQLSATVERDSALLASRGRELEEVRARLQQERRRRTDTALRASAEAERWRRILARRLRARTARAIAPLSASTALAREVARRLRFGKSLLPGSTPLLSSLRPQFRRQAALITASGLFDPDFYLAKYPDVAEADLDPLMHYVLVGGAEGRAPHPAFDASWYLRQLPSGMRCNALLHYLEHGWREGRSPHPLFRSSFYRTQEPSLATLDVEPLGHYLTTGAGRGLDPHPLFDTSFYRDRNLDVGASGVNPLVHYLQYGWREGRSPHPLFDPAFYLASNEDVEAQDLDPLVHFVTMGAAEGRKPNPWFDSAAYVNADGELRESGENPLEHYIRIGASERRAIGSSFDVEYYARANPDAAECGLDPLTHYILIGRAEGRAIEPPPPLVQPGNLEASVAAYERVMASARDAEAARLSSLVLPEPDIIRLPEDADLAAHARHVVLRAEDVPEVTVVIPVLNGIRYTLECLLSLVRFTVEHRFEAIVVDNGSSDGTGELLSAIPNLHYLRQETNAGFIAACNAGAAVARGRYLVLLNNDAQVTAGWLSPLLEAFATADRLGACGPKVLYPNGRLQEAGSAIQPDCTSRMIGLHDDPDLPRYNWPREVDYASGVCLVLETERFRALGGFSAEFAPAYCEDVDLCLRLRRDGLRILYQPASTIVHHLSATSSQLGSTFKQMIVARNQQQLAEKHQAEIDAMNKARLVAFYLPQFHPIPENDIWWGKGFTEWRNVAKARPNFEGHYQPRVSTDLGFYDLRLEEVYHDQVALASRYGLDAFCFYYYWFDGKRLLESPIERLLRSSEPTFPFCVCWANENWTRRWDGLEDEILMPQSYRDEHNAAVIEDLLRYLNHPSYLRVNGRPLLLVYHASPFPDIARTTNIWREECRRQGVGEIYLAMVESFDLSDSQVTPASCGFDAAVEFPPHKGGQHRMEPGRVLNPAFTGRVFDYGKTAQHYMNKPVPGFRRFRTVMPGWDNTPRRQDDPVIFGGSTPGAYQAWLEWLLRQTREQNTGDEQLVFVNAWNEWAEGAYLEPDLGWGHAYLEATRDAIENVRLGLRGGAGSR